MKDGYQTATATAMKKSSVQMNESQDPKTGGSRSFAHFRNLTNISKSNKPHEIAFRDVRRILSVIGKASVKHGLPIATWLSF